jgi:regulatory protein
VAHPGGAHADALEAALATLRRRDHSVQELDERLARKGIPEGARLHAVETLLRTGLLDDRRFAEARAAALAERGAGDALIRHTLACAGVAADVVDLALETIEPEVDRARAVVARRGPGARTARYLSGKGFAEDVIGVVAARAADELG